MRSKQRGEVSGLMILGILIVIALGATFLTQGRKSTDQKRLAVSVKQLKPSCEGSSCKGTYVYQNGGGDWLYYQFVFMSDSAPIANEPITEVSSRNSYSRFGASLPPGGNWVKSNQGPKTDEIEKEEQMELNESETVVSAVQKTEVQEEQEQPTEQVEQVSETTTVSEPAPDSAPIDSGSNPGSSDTGSSSDSGGGDSGGGSSD